jgi:predicted MFS family arabinose efflux permease
MTPGLTGNGEALRDPRFWLIAGSFAICGFHVAFLTVHMPGVIERCGLPATFTGLWLVIAAAANMAGSIGIGMLMKRRASAPLLALVYGTRAVAIVAFVMAPASGGVLLAFALAMGLTYMAALPPTAELLARGFGVERLSSLLGVTMLVHQVGGFFGAWLGGVAVEHSGSYTPLWIADIALAAIATGLQFALMREPPARRPAPSAAPRARWACAAAPGRLSG